MTAPTLASRVKLARTTGGTCPLCRTVIIRPADRAHQRPRLGSHRVPHPPAAELSPRTQERDYDRPALPVLWMCDGGPG